MCVEYKPAYVLCIQTHVGDSACEGQHKIVGVLGDLLYHSLTQVVEIVSSLNLELESRLALLGKECAELHLAFYLSDGHLNSCLYA